MPLARLIGDDASAHAEIDLSLRETGSEALYTRTEKNLKGGDVDMIWDGRNTEIKTPTRFHAGALSRPLKANQSNNFVIELRKPLRDSEQEARQRLTRWRIRNPEKDVWIVHSYDDNRIEKVTSDDT